MDILLKYINQMQESPKELINELDVLAKQHYQLLNKYYEKNQEYVKEIYLKVEEISRFFKMNKLITQSEEIQNRIAFLNQEMKTLDNLFSPIKTNK